jgi:hypothetical protein
MERISTLDEKIAVELVSIQGKVESMHKGTNPHGNPRSKKRDVNDAIPLFPFVYPPNRQRWWSSRTSKASVSARVSQLGQSNRRAKPRDSVRAVRTG